MSSNLPKRLGKYELQERLGQGGMAEVWKAFDPQLKRYVAIKFLHTKLGSDPEFMTRFVREGQAIASLRHPNIVQVYDFQIASPGGDGPTAYMVMDYVIGQTLADYIRRTSAIRNFPSASEFVNVFAPISLAVDYAHQHGIIHRDIKPANILLDSRNTMHNPMGEPILTDFGIVKLLGEATLTAAGVSIGTPLYISPEQVRGTQPTKESDIYSLGIMLYEMYVGTPPFRGDSPYTIMMQHLQADPPQPSLVRQGIPRALDAVISRALAKNPQERFPTAAAMTAALAEAVGIPVPLSIGRSVSLHNTGQNVPSTLPQDIATVRTDRPPMASSASDLPTVRSKMSTPTMASSASDLPTVGADVNTPPGIKYPEPVPPTSKSPQPPTIMPTVPSGPPPSQAPVSVSPQTPLPPVPLPASMPSRPAGRQRKGLIAIIGAVLLVVIIGSGLGVFLLRGYSSTSIVGHAAFTSSQQLNSQGVPGINDGMQIQLQNIPAPASGNSYYAWLQDNQTETQSIFLGALALNQGVATLSYADSQHRDLLTTMNSFLVTEENTNPPPNNPTLDKTKWRYTATLPQTPATTDHFSYLDHVRHLLAIEPALEKLNLHGGIDYWFVSNLEELQKEALEIRDHGTAPDIRQQLTNLLYYLDGKCAPQELTYAPAGSPSLPQSGTIRNSTVVGLLDCAQVPDPPGHVTHIGRHLTGIAQSPGAPADQVKRATQINSDLNNIKAWLVRVRKDALQLIAMNDTDLLQNHSLRNDLVVYATYTVSGRTDPVTQALEPSGQQIANNIELLATFDVMPFKG